ncbi:hypothetical protein O181_014851 [Austropuccinia psidii MF-1]|uniref:Uncharacterized protein n=1 Tax=Austropuccinia psidii MF-1 TaxID=1389203 RepID=A0A9Q3GPI5_9BASI|nr:hypothetical protein [Austropuccinia psidii MF-1]
MCPLTHPQTSAPPALDMLTLILCHQDMSACDSNPERKHDSQIPSINGIAKIPPEHGAEPNQLKRNQTKEETHPFSNIQVPSP